MAPYTKDKSSKYLKEYFYAKVSAYKNGKTVQFTKEHGRIIWSKALALFTTLKETFILAIFKMEKPMELGYIGMLVEISMKESGSTMKNMGLVMKLTLMGQNSKVSTKMI